MDIRTLRNTLGLNQGEFGNLFGVHPMTVSKWERGVLKPSEYQYVLMDEFDKAAQEEEVRKRLKFVLTSAGIAAALFLLLKYSRS